MRYKDKYIPIGTRDQMTDNKLMILPSLGIFKLINLTQEDANRFASEHMYTEGEGNAGTFKVPNSYGSTQRRFGWIDRYRHLLVPLIQHINDASDLQLSKLVELENVLFEYKILLLLTFGGLTATKDTKLENMRDYVISKNMTVAGLISQKDMEELKERLLIDGLPTDWIALDGCTTYRDPGDNSTLDLTGSAKGDTFTAETTFNGSGSNEFMLYPGLMSGSGAPAQGDVSKTFYYEHSWEGGLTSKSKFVEYSIVSYNLLCCKMQLLMLRYNNWEATTFSKRDWEGPDGITTVFAQSPVMPTNRVEVEDGEDSESSSSDGSSGPAYENTESTVEQVWLLKEGMKDQFAVGLNLFKWFEPTLVGQKVWEKYGLYHEQQQGYGSSPQMDQMMLKYFITTMDKSKGIVSSNSSINKVQQTGMWEGKYIEDTVVSIDRLKELRANAKVIAHLLKEMQQLTQGREEHFIQRLRSLDEFQEVIESTEEKHRLIMARYYVLVRLSHPYSNHLGTLFESMMCMMDLDWVKTNSFGRCFNAQVQKESENEKLKSGKEYWAYFHHLLSTLFERTNELTKSGEMLISYCKTLVSSQIMPDLLRRGIIPPPPHQQPSPTQQPSTSSGLFGFQNALEGLRSTFIATTATNQGVNRNTAADSMRKKLPIEEWMDIPNNTNSIQLRWYQCLGAGRIITFGQLAVVYAIMLLMYFRSLDEAFIVHTGADRSSEALAVSWLDSNTFKKATRVRNVFKQSLFLKKNIAGKASASLILQHASLSQILWLREIVKYLHVVLGRYRVSICHKPASPDALPDISHLNEPNKHPYIFVNGSSVANDNPARMILINRHFDASQNRLLNPWVKPIVTNAFRPMEVVNKSNNTPFFGGTVGTIPVASHHIVTASPTSTPDDNIIWTPLTGVKQYVRETQLQDSLYERMYNILQFLLGRVEVAVEDHEGIPRVVGVRDVLDHEQILEDVRSICRMYYCMNGGIVRLEQDLRMQALQQQTSTPNQSFSLSTALSSLTGFMGNTTTTTTTTTQRPPNSGATKHQELLAKDLLMLPIEVKGDIVKAIYYEFL